MLTQEQKRRREVINRRIEEFTKRPEENKQKEIAWRVQMLHAMHTIVCSFNHEGAYGAWICGWIPDGADEDDFQDCAEDYEHFEETVQRFKSLIKRYGGAGFFGVNTCVADEKSSDYFERINAEEDEKRK